LLRPRSQTRLPTGVGCRQLSVVILLAAVILVPAAGAQVVTVQATDAAQRVVPVQYAQGEDGSHDPGEHAPMAVDVAMNLADAVDAAYQVYPARPEVAARDREADAWEQRGKSLISGRPQLVMRYQSDRLRDDFGLEEIESGIQLPIWRPGERRSTRALGTELDGASSALREALRWEVAGRVRDALWDIAFAEGQLSIAGARVEVAERLTASIDRRHELGDVALGDLLLAQSEVLSARTDRTEASAALVDAERNYRSLTGLDRRPRFEPEMKSALTGIDETHPALTFATAEVERARALEEVTRRTALTSPTITIGPRRERSTFSQPYEDSIGVTVTVPFGGGSHVATQTAAAGRQTANAVSGRLQLLRDLDLALHEARHGLEVMASNLANAEARLELAERTFAMGETAYQGGEIGLQELLILQRHLLDARQKTLEYDVGLKRLTASYNQAVGDLP
jgi:cobalt-zinc-cadmium efflux system outer membrane protein